MDYVNLGTTGLRVSRVCLGMMSFGDPKEREWALDEASSEPIVRAAVEGGITFFDTADTYSAGASEVITGRLLRKLLSREEYVLATKVFMPMTPGENGGGLSRKHILAAIDASLQRLELDYVDLYQIHRWDNRTPIEETMDALDTVVRAGKARYIGASSMFAWQFAKAQRAAERAGLHAVRLDAEPLQPRLPRGGARDDPPLPRRGRWRDPLEPPRSRPARRQPHPRRRAPHDALRLGRLRRLSLRAADRLRRRRSRRRGRRRARRPAGAGRPRMAVPQARRHRPDRRHDQARAPNRRDRRRAARALRARRSRAWRSPTGRTPSSATARYAAAGVDYSPSLRTPASSKPK